MRKYRLREKFENPSQINAYEIENTLAWKYGKKRKSLLKNPNYKPIMDNYHSNNNQFPGDPNISD